LAQVLRCHGHFIADLRRRFLCFGHLRAVGFLDESGGRRTCRGDQGTRQDIAAWGELTRLSSAEVSVRALTAFGADDHFDPAMMGRATRLYISVAPVAGQQDAPALPKLAHS
jgi:hypothetical protein